MCKNTKMKVQNSTEVCKNTREHQYIVGWGSNLLHVVINSNWILIAVQKSQYGIGKISSWQDVAKALLMSEAKRANE